MNDYVKMRNETTLLGDCFVPFKDVVKCTTADRIDTAITYITDKQFCHIPVLDQCYNHVVGVFSISTLMEIVHARTPGYALLNSIRPCLKTHKFEEFPFVASTNTVAQAQEIWKSTQEQGKHVGLFLVTDTGQTHEPLRGVFTEWDFAKASEKPLSNKE